MGILILFLLSKYFLKKKSLSKFNFGSWEKNVHCKQFVWKLFFEFE